MRASVVFVTGRMEPRLDWIIDGLVRQGRSDDDLDILVVDAIGREFESERSAFSRFPGTVRMRSVRAKPNIFQGAHRVTKCDWWAASSARNTGFIYAATDYVAFLDDRSHLSPKWLECVRRGERERTSVLAGTYDKLENGTLTTDTRRDHSPNGKINCGGGWLYGCTFALPLEWALNVNGFEEGCDGQGAEDYIFGLNLEHAGYRIDFVTEFGIRQERNEIIPSGGAGSSGYKREDKGVSPNDKSHAALARFGSRARTEFTPDLRELRAMVARGEPLPVPDPHGDYRDWFDGQLIRDMV